MLHVVNALGPANPCLLIAMFWNTCFNTCCYSQCSLAHQGVVVICNGFEHVHRDTSLTLSLLYLKIVAVVMYCVFYVVVNCFLCDGFSFWATRTKFLLTTRRKFF